MDDPREDRWGSLDGATRGDPGGSPPGTSLQVAVEVRAWLNDLRSAEPATARLAAEAVIALLDEGSGLGPPLLAPARAPIRVADEEKLTADYQRLQAKVDAFRSRKQTVKASYQAAQAVQDAGGALASVGGQAAGADAAEARAREVICATLRAVEELLGSDRDVERAVGAETGALVEDRGTPTPGPVTPRPGPATPQPDPATPPPGPAAPQPDLMELRPGASASSGICILLAVPQPGVPVLLAAAEVDHVARYDLAISLARVRLRALAEARPRPAGEGIVTSFTSYDKESFLREFCPGEAAEAQAGAAALAARNRAHRLVELRRRSGLTQAQVAERMRIGPERVWEIEHGTPDGTEVGTLAAYVAALGGRLDIVAELGAEQIVLQGRPVEQA